MTVEMFLILLTSISIITSLLTEAVKKLLNKEAPSNVIVLIIATIVGGAGTSFYYVLNDVPFNAVNVTYIILMCIANWLTAMLGYDKVMQAISQIKG